MKKGALGGIISGVIIFGAIIIYLTGLKKVPAGYVGVVYNFSTGVSGDVVGQGWHWVPPTKRLLHIQ